MIMNELLIIIYKVLFYFSILFVLLHNTKR